MTAATNQATTNQAALQQPTRPREQRPRLAIWGLLDEAAHIFVQNGRVHLQVVLAQHLQQHREARRILATLAYPEGADIQATELQAQAVAHGMRTRTEVVVVGSGLFPTLHCGQPVNQLESVQSIRLAADVIEAHSNHLATGVPHHVSA
jgi:hypothetical protein